MVLCTEEVGGCDIVMLYIVEVAIIMWWCMMGGCSAVGAWR